MVARAARIGRSVVVGALFALVPASEGSAQNVLAVPTDFPTIQAAINAAVDGDTVVVDPGTYHEAIDLLGKEITVESVAGPESTIIDAGLADSTVILSASYPRSPVLRGFTIRGGRPNGPGGGGIYALNGAARIENNVVTGNFGCFGAGILVYFTAATIRGNTISDNAPNCSGGAGGGGIAVAGNLGVGVPVQVLDNVIAGNVQNSFGGGLLVYFAGPAVIAGNVIRGNEVNGVTGAGGGVWIQGTPGVALTNNVIAGNSAFEGGGLYWATPSGPTVINNTIADNAAVLGSAVFAIGNDARMTNNILVGAGTTVLQCLATPPSLAFNDVVHLVGSTLYGGTCSDQTGLNGNISTDPFFVDAAGGDFHLQPGSPAIDAGSNADAPPLDIDGDDRPADGDGDGVSVADLGADEVVLPDAEPPTIAVPGLWDENATSPEGAVVNYPVSVSDNVDPAPVLVCSPESGSLFPMLFTTVHCTATDAAGNTAEASFEVLVKDANWQLADLIGLVESWDLRRLGTSLTDKLYTAQRFVLQGKSKQACESLGSVLSQLGAQTDKGLTPDQVLELTTSVFRIRNVVGCS